MSSTFKLIRFKWEKSTVQRKEFEPIHAPRTFRPSHSFYRFLSSLIFIVWHCIRFQFSIFFLSFFFSSNYKFHYIYAIHTILPSQDQTKRQRIESHRKSLSMPKLLLTHKNIRGRFFVSSYFLLLWLTRALWIRGSWFIEDFYEFRRHSITPDYIQIYLSSAAPQPFDINHRHRVIIAHIEEYGWEKLVQTNLKQTDENVESNKREKTSPSIDRILSWK